MSGQLYLCATPIGNLEDMTYRAVRVLGEVDLIAAEDTRNSIRLLNYFHIDTPMTSYHEFNKTEKGKRLIRFMSEGKTGALISGAGTPAISDPGEELVRMCYDAGIPVTVLPGASACITAVAQSGLSTRRFVFEGFLPQDHKEKRAALERLGEETRTIVVYEAPHRLKATLQELYRALGDREMTVCRELTKRFEEKTRTTIAGAIDALDHIPPRGEYVLVIAGRSPLEIEQEQRKKWETVSLQEHMKFYEEQGLSRKEAMRCVARDRGVSRRDIYQQLL